MCLRPLSHNVHRRPQGQGIIAVPCRPTLFASLQTVDPAARCAVIQRYYRRAPSSLVRASLPRALRRSLVIDSSSSSQRRTHCLIWVNSAMKSAMICCCLCRGFRREFERREAPAFAKRRSPPVISDLAFKRLIRDDGMMKVARSRDKSAMPRLALLLGDAALGADMLSSLPIEDEP
jgi:hypothetical protein